MPSVSSPGQSVNLSPVSASRGQLSFAAPRPSNTGAQKADSPLRSVKLDWLDFTVKGFSLVAVATSFLGFDWRELVLEEGGARGHTQMWSYAGVTLLCTPEKPERGVKVIIPGSALSCLQLDHLDLLRQVLHSGGSFARIDVAFDDLTGVLTPDRLMAAISAGYHVTHLKEVDPRKPVDLRTGELVGNSVALGSRASARFLRCYDKRLQQIRDKKASPADLPPVWTRLELETKKRGALVLASALVSNGLAAIPGIIRGVFDLRAKDNKDTKRRTVLAWWGELFDGAAIIRCGVQKVVATVEEKLVWLAHTCKKAIGQVVAHYGAPVLRQIAMQGIKATTSREWSRIMPQGQRLNLGIELIDLAAPLTV